MVEAGISLQRVRSFLLCHEHPTIGPGSLEDIGISMANVSSAYESNKPTPAMEGEKYKDLAEKQWEVSLLKLQLEEAESKIRQLTGKQKSGPSYSRSGSSMSASIHSNSDDGYMVGGDSELPTCASNPSLLCLKRINFTCEPGQLIAVVGGVGCGK